MCSISKVDGPSRLCMFSVSVHEHGTGKWPNELEVPEGGYSRFAPFGDLGHDGVVITPDTYEARRLVYPGCSLLDAYWAPRVRKHAH